MPEVFYTMLTNAGKAKIANATILNTKVNFSKIAVGDSNGSYYNPTEVQTSLVHEVWQGSVGNIRIDEHNSNWIVVESIIPPTTGGFMIREVGLFDDEGDLLVIAKYPETYKPTANDGTVKELIVKVVLEVANTSVVTLKIDPTVIVATKQDIIDMGNKKANLIHNHNDLYHTKNEISTLLDNKVDKDPIFFNVTLSNKLKNEVSNNPNTINGAIKLGKIVYFNEQLVVNPSGGNWNHGDVLMTIPEGFYRKNNNFAYILLMIPRRNIHFDCRIVLDSSNGNIWLHSSESDGSKFLRTDYLHFFGIWTTD